jgi:hypothetical protein
LVKHVPTLTHKLAVCTSLFFLLLYSFVFVSTAQHRFLENGNPLLRGADAGFLLDTPTREKIDLSGNWNYSLEGGPAGVVKVPSAFDFVGTVTFERTFDVTAEQIDRYDFHLVMLGSNYSSEISINGDFLTHHFGGYTSFVQPIGSNTLQPGANNTIRVVVSNALDARRTLPLKSQVWGWRNYGGILRDVYILATPRLYITEVVVKADLAPNMSSAKVTLIPAVEGVEPPSEEGPQRRSLGIIVEMFDKITGIQVGRSAVAPLTREGNRWSRPPVELTLQNPKLWSPEYPELYYVKTYVVQTVGRDVSILDEYSVNYGIRRIEITDRVLLNGRRVFLRGVVWNEEHPTWGSSMTYEEMEKDIVLIKSLGANLIRFLNHPPHPYMLNLCDRYGLLAMVEIPVVNAPAAVLSDDFIIDLAGTMLREMIVRDRTHPSVFAWGIGDEFESSSQAARRYVETMVRTAKQLDARPVYYGSRFVGSDVCIDLVDLAAVNIHADDGRVFKSRLDTWKTAHKGKPLIVSKFGTEVRQDNRSGYSDPLSQEAQARFYIQRFETIRSLDFDGGVVWAFNDWKGDRPALTINSGDPWMHTLGLVSYLREKRLAYDAVRSVFRNEKFAALPIGNYTPSAPIIYVLSGLVVLIGVAYFYNVNRRFRENLNRSVMNAYNFFADVRDQRSVSIVQSSVLGVIVSAATAIVFSSILYHFKDSVVLDNALSVLLIHDNVKEGLVHLIRDPLKFILYASALFFGLLLLLTAFLMVVAPVFKTRIYLFHAYTITMWATPPLLVLVPVGMILYRIMESHVYVVPGLILVGVLLAWVVLRLLKAIAIVFDAYPVKVYFVGLLSLVGVLAIVYLYFDYTQSASVYMKYMYNMMVTSQ